MHSARARFAFLWFSQTTRTMADWCLRTYAVLILAEAMTGGKAAAWHVVTALFIAPSLLLAPFHGAICNSLSKRLVLFGSATYCGVILLMLPAVGGRALPGLSIGLLLVALGAALYNPVRYALLPAAALDLGVPLHRLNAWIELGIAAAIVGGVLSAFQLGFSDWHGLPLSLVLSVLLSVAALAAAWPVWFAADVCRPESPRQALTGFFRDGRRIWRERTARSSLLQLSGFLALVTAGSGAMVMLALDRADADGSAAPGQAMLLVTLGVAVGSWLAGRPRQPRRALIFVPVGAVGLVLTLGWTALHAGQGGGDILALPCLLMGFLGGLTNVPLRAWYQGAVPADARGNGMAIANFFIYGFIALLSLLLTGLAAGAWLPTPLHQLWFLTGLTGVGALFLLRSHVRWRGRPRHGRPRPEQGRLGGLRPLRTTAAPSLSADRH